MKFISMFSFGLLISGLLSSASFANLQVGQVMHGSTGSFTVQNIQECQQNSPDDSSDDSNEESVGSHLFQARYLDTGFSCVDKAVLEASLSVARITIAITNVGLICSGIASPVAIALSGIQAGLSMVDLVVSNLECVDTRANERNRLLIKQSICEALSAQGYDCDPIR